MSDRVIYYPLLVLLVRLAIITVIDEGSAAEALLHYLD
jgi:hypothetical protein